MMTYSTLQEAWGVPMFLKQRKRVERAERAEGTKRPPVGPVGQEDFENADLPEFKKNYSSEENDYKYYCKTYGLCGIKEKFAAGTDEAGKAGKEAGGAKSQACGLPDSNYEYPLSESDKQQFKKTLDVAMQGSNAQAPAVHPFDTPKQGSSDNVTGYYDEDLEDYLETKDVRYTSGEPIDFSVGSGGKAGKKAGKAGKAGAQQALPNDPASNKYAPPMASAFGTPTLHPDVAAFPRDRASDNANHGDKKSYWESVMDIILFIGVGVLIIFIMDQLYRLAMLAGMRQTVHALEPFLLHMRDHA